MLLWDQLTKERVFCTLAVGMSILCISTAQHAVMVAMATAIGHYLVTYRTLDRIILVGPACAGKDYLRDTFDRHGVAIDVSVTTREPRNGEIPGYTYNYITDHEMDDLVRTKSLYEYVRFGDKQYGTLLTSWNTSKVFIMSPDGVTKNIRPEDRSHCYVVYLDPPEDVLAARWEARRDVTERVKRVATDQVKFSGFIDYDLRITDPQVDTEELVGALLNRLEQ